MRRPIAIAVLVAAIGILSWTHYYNSKPSSSAPPPSTAMDVMPLAGGLSVSSPSPSPFVSPVSALKITSHDREKLKILDQIFKTRNDNDPRMDRDLKNLTPGTKFLLEKKYAALPAESRNQRGTIVFLLGRDLATTGRVDDFAFFDQVAQEPACLSLGDCTHETKAGPEDSHEETAIGVTLTYPQRMLIVSLSDFLQKHPDSPLAANSVQTLTLLSHSAIPSVAQKAEQALSQYSAGHP